MTILSKIATIAATALMLSGTSSAFAQQGTTLAGPAQGSKGNGEASTKPSGASAGSSGSATTGTKTGDGTATGTGDSKSTATGGNAGGPAGRN